MAYYYPYAARRNLALSSATGATIPYVSDGTVIYPNGVGLAGTAYNYNTACPQNPYQNRFCVDAFGIQTEVCPFVNNCGQPRIYYDAVTGVMVGPRVNDIAPVDNQGIQVASGINNTINSLGTVVPGTAGDNYPYNTAYAYPGV